MKKKTEELLQEAFRIMGEDIDIMIVTHNDGKCSASVHGSVENIAKSTFTFMHSPEDKIGQALYRILRLNVLNILGNWTTLANDFIEMIGKLVEKVTEKKDKDDEVQQLQ